MPPVGMGQFGEPMFSPIVKYVSCPPSLKPVAGSACQNCVKPGSMSMYALRRIRPGSGGAVRWPLMLTSSSAADAMSSRRSHATPSQWKPPPVWQSSADLSARPNRRIMDQK
jgi:hypothetical protein